MKSNNADINVPEPFANTQGVVPTLMFTGAPTASSVIGYGPYTEYNRNYNFFDNLTWIRGRHTLKFGFSSNRYQKTENAASDQGTFTFSNQGNPGSSANSFYQSWANFLLGNVATFTQPSTDITPNIWAWQHEAYAQDDFRVTPRLTAYFGVRWSFFGEPTDANNLLDNFDPALNNRANAPQINPSNGNIVPGTGNNTSLNGVIVGGKGSPFGAAVSNSNYADFAPRMGLAWDPFGGGKTSIRAGYGVYYDSPLFGGYEQNTFANPPYVQSVTYNNASFSNVASAALSVSASPLALHATPIPFRSPYVQQWSFDVQRQLPRDMILDVGYYGSKGTHLLGIVDINEAYPGVALTTGLHAPNGNTVFTTADTPNINAVRPYLGFNTINAIETAFDSNYHSLQVGFRKQFAAAGLIGAAYTYSKNLTDNWSDRSNAPQNSYNWHEGEYGPAMLDRTHVFTLNYVYV
ncbi:MAG: adenylyl cyclase, partial [Acidobacteriia bacterium]|nr:adenylyl cyclase [Terriglobia bacterium]